MNDDAERKLAAHQSFYAALVEVEAGYRDGAEGNVDDGAQQDAHVKAWLDWCATQKQAAE